MTIDDFYFNNYVSVNSVDNFYELKLFLPNSNRINNKEYFCIISKEPIKNKLLSLKKWKF